MSLPVTFKFDNKLYNVDINKNLGLYRQNASTAYEHVYTFMIRASELTNCAIGQPLFYLVATQENGWVQVDVNTGENLLNIFKNTQNQTHNWADIMDDEDMD